MTGVTIAGEKYMYLSGDDKVLRCKKGTSGVHVMKTVQAYIIAVYHDPIVAPQVCPRELSDISETKTPRPVSVRCSDREIGRVSHQRRILRTQTEPSQPLLL